jgi:hypothetical protein
MEYRRRPCPTGPGTVGCPWLRDTDLTCFSDRDFEKLARADGTADQEAPLSAPLMSCHQDQPDTAHPLRLCAGWLAVVGGYHFAVRTGIIAGDLPGEVTAPQQGWAALYPSLADMLTHRSDTTPGHAVDPARDHGSAVADVHWDPSGHRSR